MEIAVTVSAKALLASFEILYLIAKNKKLRTVADVAATGCHQNV
jgi:hypothetical protein